MKMEIGDNLKTAICAIATTVGFLGFLTLLILWF